MAPATAMAQPSRAGETFLVANGLARGSSVAYDSRNDVYLVVSAHGVVQGRFVRGDGAVLGTPFQVQQVVFFGQFPSVAFSPDANAGNGAFLISWHESDGAAPSVHTRMVSYTSGFISPDRKVTGNDSYWEIMGAPVAYSTVSHEFMVIWRAYFATDILGMFIGNDGAAVSAAFPVATTPVFESNHSLTYNPVLDEFYVVYSYGVGTVAARGQRIKPGTGAQVGGPATLGGGPSVNQTAVTYNPRTGQYLAAWHQLPQDAILSRVVAADGTPIGNVNVLSTRYGTYDSVSVSANQVTGTSFMVGHDKLSVEDGGVEVAAGGTPTTAGLQATAAGGGGNFYPRVSAHSTRGEWMISSSNGFARTIAQRVATATAPSGNPAPGPTPGPPTPTSSPLMSIDLPLNNSIVPSNGFIVAGWAIDRGAATSSGIDAIHVYAWPVGGGNPTFLGVASYGSQRPDVAAFFGSQFASPGFNFVGSGLLPGAYDIAVYAHSMLTGTFESRVARVTVVAPVSHPRMWVDLPSAGQNTSQNLTVSGWAVDLASKANAGVDAVHVYAYQAGSSTPIFLGVATMRLGRPDVANAFASGAYLNSGFRLDTTIAPGPYTLVVFAHSSITGTFNNALSIPFTAR